MCVCVCMWAGGARASFPAARDLQVAGIFGRAHEESTHTFWQRRPPRLQWRRRTSRPDDHTASHVASERTTKVIPQIQCAPCHARSLSVHGIFGPPRHNPPGGNSTAQNGTCTPPRPARNAHPPPRLFPRTAAPRSCTKHGVHTMPTVEVGSDMGNKKKNSPDHGEIAFSAEYQWLLVSLFVSVGMKIFKYRIYQLRVRWPTVVSRTLLVTRRIGQPQAVSVARISCSCWPGQATSSVVVHVSTANISQYPGRKHHLHNRETPCRTGVTHVAIASCCMTRANGQQKVDRTAQHDWISIYYSK